MFRLRGRRRGTGPVLSGRGVPGRRGVSGGQPESIVLVQVRRGRPVHRRLQDGRGEPVQRRGAGRVQPGRAGRHRQDRVVHRGRPERLRGARFQGRQSRGPRRPGLRARPRGVRARPCARRPGVRARPRPGVRARRLPPGRRAYFLSVPVQTSSVKR